MLKVCIDTNIWISGVMFSGKPAEVINAALNRKFELILSTVILEEIEKNLTGKFKLSQKNTQKFINRILQVTDLYEPRGTVRIVAGNHPDNLILETASLGRAKFLVTGDKEHLLPLKIFKHVKIVDAGEFLNQIKK
jgi:putative PIN family toxin of toxin-antitoxin system